MLPDADLQKINSTKKIASIFRTRYVEIGSCLLLAILFHMFSFYVIPKINPIRREAVVTKIQIVQVPVTVPVPVAPSVKSRIARPRGSTQSQPNQVAAIPRFHFGKSGYNKLLPNDEAALKGGGELNARAPLGAKLSPEFQSHMAIIASEIDIPLFWRQTAKASKASADLVLHDDNTIWCRLLVGTPILRAVLWKYLSRPSVQAELANVFRMSGKKDYRIVLKFFPEPGPERTINFADDTTAYQLGVEIIKTLPTPTRSFGGMDIENEDSRKAKLRDRLALSKLYESPAFNNQIRDAKL